MTVRRKHPGGNTMTLRRRLPGGGTLSRRRFAIAALAILLISSSALAGAWRECRDAGSPEAVAKCLTALDLQTLSALKQAETETARAAREFEDRIKRPGAYTAFAASTRAFALYQQAQCDYEGAMEPDGNVRATSSVPTAAELSKIACRIDLARERIRNLRP